MAAPARSIPIEPDALLARLHPLRPAAVSLEALASDALLGAAIGCVVVACLALLALGPLTTRRRDPLRAARGLAPPQRIAACIAVVRDAACDASGGALRAVGASWAQAYAERVGRPAPPALLDASARLYRREAPPGAAEAEAVEAAARQALKALRRAGGRARHV